MTPFDPLGDDAAHDLFGPRDEDQRSLTARIADELRRNDECGAGPLSDDEYMDDAAAILRIVNEHRSPQSESVAGEDYEALQRAVRAFVESWWEFDSLPPQDHYNAVAERVQVLDDILSRVSAPKADENQEAR